MTWIQARRTRREDVSALSLSSYVIERNCSQTYFSFAAEGTHIVTGKKFLGRVQVWERWVYAAFNVEALVDQISFCPRVAPYEEYDEGDNTCDTSEVLVLPVGLPSFFGGCKRSRTPRVRSLNSSTRTGEAAVWP